MTTFTGLLSIFGGYIGYFAAKIVSIIASFRIKHQYRTVHQHFFTTFAIAPTMSSQQLKHPHSRIS